MKQKIFIALSTFAEHGDQPLRLLEQSGIPFVVNTLGRRLCPDDLAGLALDATGIVAGVEPYDRSVLESLPALKCISRCGVGMDNIDRPFAQERGVLVCNTPDVVIQPVAELTVAMVFDLMRHLSYHTAVLKSKQWKKKAGRLLTEQVVGVVGLGRIGKRVAEIFRALGVQVIGSDCRPDLDWAEQKSVEMMELQELLKLADIVSINLSPQENGRAIFDQAVFSNMKDGAVLVNTSRGNLVDEDALAQAIKSGKLAGAGMDVFSEEPYRGPLCDFDNVVMTPHVATLTKESRLQMETESVQNLLEKLHG
jgi:D-3-phosphoglycerate dehydrogenase / 2-oxoglutarate reductase